MAAPQRLNNLAQCFELDNQPTYRVKNKTGSPMLYLVSHNKRERNLVRNAKRALKIISSRPDYPLTPDQVKTVESIIDPLTRPIGYEFAFWQEKEKAREDVYKRWNAIPRKRRTPELWRQLVIECKYGGKNAAATIYAAYNGYFDTRFYDGQNPDGPGPDVDSNSIYIGIPKFDVANSTLEAACGFVPWQVDPRTMTRARPASWPSAPTDYNYFINPSHPDSTDTANQFGYPDKPRKTINTATMSALPAGSLVVLSGNASTTYNTSDLIIRGAQGGPTESEWIHIRIDEDLADVDRPKIVVNGPNSYINCEGSSYICFDRLFFDGNNLSNLAWSTSYNGGMPEDTHHIVLRYPDIKNHAWISGGGGIINISADDRNGGKKTHDIAVLMGDIAGTPPDANWTDPSKDPDNHLIGISTRTGANEAIDGRTEVSKIWVLGNKFRQHSGSAVQIISTGAPTKPWRLRQHHIWVGGNDGGHGRQCPYWSKAGSDIIFSQNISDTNLSIYNAGNGQATGCQYQPTDVWWIGNVFSNSCYGVQMTGDNPTLDPTDPAEYGRLYIIGNIFKGFYQDHDRDQVDNWRDSTAIAVAAQRYKIWACMNTVDRLVNGFVDGTNNMYFQSSSNIFALKDGTRAANTTGANQGIFYQTVAGNRGAVNDILYRVDGSFRANIGGTTYTTAASINALSGYTGLLDGDPLFVDADGGDYQLQSGSPGVAGGSYVFADGVNALSVFTAKYGMSIAWDLFRNARSPSAPNCGAVAGVAA